MGMRYSSLASQQTGFTLIELMVTVSIMGILLAASLPSVGVWLSNQRIRNTASSISAGIQYAQTEAVRRNRPVTFWLVSLSDASSMNNSCALSASSGSWVVTLGNTSPAGKCAPGSSTKQLKAALANDGGGGSALSIAASNTTNSTTANQITYNGFGQIASTTPIQQVNVSSSTSGTLPLRVAINSGGQVKLCNPAITSATDSRYCS
jgi:type IV fimbrial biogenesis protein FimT